LVDSTINVRIMILYKNDRLTYDDSNYQCYLLYFYYLILLSKIQLSKYFIYSLEL